MEKYICIKDLQYGDFAVNTIATIEEWREIALSWAWSDDNEELQETLSKLKQENVIDFIQDIWQIEIVKLFEDTEKIIKLIDKEYEKICDKQNVSNALDFVQEVKDYLIRKYMIN